MRKLKEKQGFTLIELVVVMAIIAVLAALIIGAIIVARRTASETQNRTNAKAIQTALESYYSRNKSYPVIASGTSFADAIASPSGKLTGLGVSLSSCKNGATETNGGAVYSAATAYSIKVYQSDCATATGEYFYGPDTAGLGTF